MAEGDKVERCYWCNAILDKPHFLKVCPKMHIDLNSALATARACLREAKAISQESRARSEIIKATKRLQEENKLLRRISQLEAACREALNWFQQFGYNDSGIAVKGDIQDHGLIITSLEEVLGDRE